MNKCIICGNQTQEIYTKNSGIFHECGHCEFIAKDRKILLSSKDELHHYNQHNNSIDDEKYVQFFYDFLNSAVFPFSMSKIALDFGSGPTPVLAQILSKFHDFDVDIYDKFYAPKKVFLDKQYPIILSTEVVEHVENPMEVFTLFKKLMDRDSILAIMTLYHPQNREKFRNWYYTLDKTHISFFSFKTMQYIAKKFDFEMLYSDKKRYITFKIKA